MDGPTATTTGARRCPRCDRLTDEPLCPADRTVTLLARAPASAELELGQIVARYELEQIIGRGGFGAVYRARHLGTGQHVALKVLSRQEDDIATKRFFQEAQATSRLRHPNTIRVFDFGQDEGGRLYLAMELLSGRTLRQAMRERQHTAQVFSEREAAEIGVAILKSLAEAHREGLVHRDIKPDNIFLHQLVDEDPVVKVLDFGIAKLRDAQQALTSQSAVPGTPTFMSPEHALNRDLDGRSDLYSLGVLLFLLVAARAPFRAEGALQTLYMHVHLPVPDLAKVARTPVTPHFVGVVRRALQKSPEDRFASARDMRAELERCLDDGWLRSSTSSGVAIPSLNLRFAQIVPVADGAAAEAPQPVVPLSREATTPARPPVSAEPPPLPEPAVHTTELVEVVALALPSTSAVERPPGPIQPESGSAQPETPHAPEVSGGALSASRGEAVSTTAEVVAAWTSEVPRRRRRVSALLGALAAVMGGVWLLASASSTTLSPSGASAREVPSTLVEPSASLAASTGAPSPSVSTRPELEPALTSAQLELAGSPSSTGVVAPAPAGAGEVGRAPTATRSAQPVVSDVRGVAGVVAPTDPPAPARTEARSTVSAGSERRRARASARPSVPPKVAPKAREDDVLEVRLQ